MARAAPSSKSSSPPSRAPRAGRRPARDDDAPPASPANDDAPREDDDDATKGEWLFKQDDTVLGPVSAIVLVEKIKKGELDGDTPVARDGQPFRSMKLVRTFRDAWQGALEEKRLAAEERAYQSAVRRVAAGRVVVLLLCVVAPFFAAAAGGRALMAARPWDDLPKWVAKVPGLVDLPQRPPDVKIGNGTQSGPQNAGGGTPNDGGKGATGGGDVVARNGGTSGNAGNAGTVRHNDAGGTTSGDKAQATTGGAAGNDAGNSATAKGDDKQTGKTGDDARNSGGGVASLETLTNEQAIAPLKTIAPALKACFKAEMESNPEMPAQVVLSYTVTEAGRAINVDLDSRDLRGRPVVDCVRKAVGSLSWPRFSGERKNVSVPFKLGKPK